MATFLNCGLSLLVAVVYLTATYLYGSGADVLRVATALVLPMACIWFPEALGEYTGTMRLHAVTASTPAFLVCTGGWLLLVGVPVAAYFIMRANAPT